MSVCHVLKKFISQWKYLAAIWTILLIMYWFVSLEILLGREPLIAVSAWVWSVMHAVNMPCQKVLLGEAPLAQMALIYSCSVDIKVSFGRIPLTMQIELKPYKDQRFSELKAQIDSTADEITW